MGVLLPCTQDWMVGVVEASLIFMVGGIVTYIHTFESGEVRYYLKRWWHIRRSRW